MINTRKTVESGDTPEKITLSMIDKDLKDGVSKADMAIKYNIKPWEVDEMFKHPFLKGRRPSRKRALSFNFVDDMSNEVVKEVIEEVDPNQVTLDQAIDDAIEAVEHVKAEMVETERTILDILSPTEYETPEETLLKAASNIDDPEFTPPSINETMDLVKEQQEDELEMEDDTFEL